MEKLSKIATSHPLHPHDHDGRPFITTQAPGSFTLRFCTMHMFNQAFIIIPDSAHRSFIAWQWHFGHFGRDEQDKTTLA